MIKEIKSRRIRWTGHRGMCREWERQNVDILFNMKENEHLEYFGTRAEIILK
jgi:hypothetical protein